MDLARFYAACAGFYDDDVAALRTPDDVGLYLALARERGGPVLETGCGSGRVLLPTARAGFEVTGVDASAEMLDRLRTRLAGEPEEVRRRVTLVHGDLRDPALDLGRTFPLVTAPFRVVQHLLTRDDQRAWLRTAARHLSPGGELVFDVFQTDFEYLAEPLDEAVDVDRRVAGGRRLRRFVSAAHTPEEQTFRMHVTWRLGEPEDDDYEEQAAETDVRWFTRAELENLLELEGYEVLDVWGDFHRTPHGPGADEIVVRARRAGGR